MLRDKDAYLKFFFNPPEAEQLLEYTKLKPRIGKSHITKMVKNPQMILKYTHALDETLQSMGVNGVEIRVASIASLNGRPYQLMIDPNRDLTKVSYGFFSVPNWIVPLEKSQRPGLYPSSKEVRMKAIQATFNRDVVPVLSQIKRRNFNKPFEELLKVTSPEAAEEYGQKNSTWKGDSREDSPK